MASENKEIMDATWALIQRTRREIAQLRSEIENTMDTVDHSRQLLSRTASRAKTTESAHDNA
jgi:hypothetical protein